MKRCILGAVLAGLLAALPGGQPFAADDKKLDLSKLPPPAAGKIDFAKDIQPIFELRCIKCHSATKESAGLRLDDADAAAKGGNSGAAWKAGDSSHSRIIHMVSGLDPETKMPPAGKGRALTAAEIGKLRAWIDQGAAFPKAGAGGATLSLKTDHWSFQPIRRPAAPTVKNPAWVRNPIDNFILARLEAEGIAPSPEADKITLIRRLSFDLIGLPPSPAEVDEFLADNRPDAYDRLVDRLLASPHYGERWGRHWLDAARYADSDGYEKDTGRPFAWRFRDWVIAAVNGDMPFDRFTIEQLAGDLLPGATLEQKIATGFHRNTLTNREGGVDQEQFRVEAVVDRVGTTGKVWLGLTIACSQCHDHKYDPISQRDYYRLFAFFNSDGEVNIPAPLAREQEVYDKAKAAHDKKKADIDAAIKAREAELPAAQAAWEQSLGGGASAGVWRTLSDLKIVSAGGATFAKLDDGSYRVEGTAADIDTYTITAPTDMAGITAVRLEVLPDDKLPVKGPGRADNGNFVLSAIKLSAAGKDAKGKAKPVAFARAAADFSQDGWAVAGAIDADAKTGWAVSPNFGRRHAAVFETKQDVGSAGGSTLTVVLEQSYGSKHTIGRFRLSATTAKRPVPAEGLPETVTKLLAVSMDKRDAKQKAELAKFYRGLDPKVAELNKSLTEHAKAKLPTPSQAQTLALGTQRKTHVLIRGDFLRPGAEVSAGIPTVMPAASTPPPAADPAVAKRGPTRLDLAHWLTDPANPLPARVTTNWMWMKYFGRGIVATPDDFGTQGERPSHPELLDWMASELVRLKWSMKAMHKTIVSSAAYRQSSRTRPELNARDAINILLARQNRSRLEAESIRDIALAASGLLTRQIGGPSIRPPQPAGTSELTYAGSAKWTESTGADRYRRGMYILFQRTSPYPMLMAFDSPDSNVCIVRRERSNTPLQSLTLLNDPVFVEAAQALGKRIVEEKNGPAAERIKHAFRLVSSRPPTAEEFAVLSALFEKLLASAKANPEAAAKLIGKYKPSTVDVPEAAAWAAFARALLNLDETVTRE